MTGETPGLVLTGFSWLTTYAVHSSILLGAVWLATRCLRRMPDEIQESLWRAALLGGLATTTWQVLGPAEPLGGTVHLTSAPQPTVAVEAIPRTSPWPEDVTALAAPAPRIPVAPLETLRTEPVVPTFWSTLDPWTVAFSLYALVVLGACGHLFVARARFHARLRNRELIDEGDMPLLLLRLVKRSGFPRAVRLTTSDRIATPIAFGVRQPEICVPRRALDELALDEQESMLAHELAHLIHRDPAWLLTLQILQRCLFVQPLHLLARRHLQQLAEYRCDAWAAHHAENQTSLARCLVEVAQWISPTHRAPVHATGMANQRSLLWQRVGRILDEPARPRRPKVAALASLGLLAASLAVLPSASWRPATIAPASTGANAPLPHIVPLDVVPGLAALDDELSLLTGELDRLRSALAEFGPDPEITAVIERLVPYLDDLARRRDQLRFTLPHAEEVLRAGTSPVDGNHNVTDQGDQR